MGAAGGRALLLPQIRALGDLDEGEPPFEPGEIAADLPPAVTPLRRRFELARLVAEHGEDLGRRPDAAGALDLADALAAFLDSAAIEEVDAAGRLPDLAPAELARHWALSRDFLAIAVEAWPRRLAALGLVDVTVRRTELLRRLADQWRAQPPEHPLVAAGSTGTAPATADLLAVVAACPRGAVVVPGLDLELHGDVWRLLPTADGEAHPQGAMARLLARARVERGIVRRWPGSEPETASVGAVARTRVLNEALRPAVATEDWLSVIADFQRQGDPAGVNPLRAGLEGLSVLTARDEEGAAAQAAVLLREALETPGATAALVTPDAALARRVSARLERWGVHVDNSAGAPLAGFPAGVLLTLLARAVADPLDPATLLALAKHPLTLGGVRASHLDLARRRLERRGLRGPRPAGWTDLDTRLAEQPEALALAAGLRAAVEHAAAPFAAGTAAAEVAVRALAEGLERLASDDGGRLGELWAGPGGEAAASLVAALVEDGAGLPPCDPARLRAAGGDTGRAAGGAHRRRGASARADPGRHRGAAGARRQAGARRAGGGRVAPRRGRRPVPVAPHARGPGPAPARAAHGPRRPRLRPGRLRPHGDPDPRRAARRPAGGEVTLAVAAGDARARRPIGRGAPRQAPAPAHAAGGGRLGRRP